MKLLKTIFRRFYYLKSYLKFKSYGKNILLSAGGTIIRPEEITLGNNIFIARGFHISARNLTFGNNIMIGPNLVIECDNHSYSEPGKTMFQIQNNRIIGQVTIEDDVWMGSNVTVLPNIIIREGSVIGAGSIITKSLPPYTICVGTLCHPIKTRFKKEDLKIHLQKISSKYNFDEVIQFWEESNLIK